MRLKAVFILSLFSIILCGQVSDNETRTALNMLKEFVALPNFGLDENDISKNIEWVDDAFSKLNFKTEILPTEGNPLFLAQKIIDHSLPTILFYMHLDGQAVDSKKWNQADPYQAVLMTKNDHGTYEEIPWKSIDGAIDPNWRAYGRSASDDKGPIIAFLSASKSLLDSGNKPAFNVKVILDAEEEIGSKSLAAAVVKYRDKLKADALIINDGPVHPSGKPTLTFGCRGIAILDMTVYGPVLPQHSGHYGNYAPNPIFKLSHLLSSMKNKDGKVIIEGYYDGIHLDENIKKQLASVPDDETGIKDLLQIASPEKVGFNYQESLQYPSLNARGIASGWVGAKARTIVPDHASVAIDMRLVPESDPDKLVAAIRKHIEDQGYYIVEHEPTKEERLKYPNILYLHQNRATLPFRTNLDDPLGIWLEESIKTEFKIDPIKIRIMGGTVPIASFINELNVPAVIVPMVNPDNNQHSPNENMRIGHLQSAIRMFKTILVSEYPTLR